VGPSSPDHFAPIFLRRNPLVAAATVGATSLSASCLARLATFSPVVNLARLAAKSLVCGLDSTLAVATFEPAHHEVRTRHLLEVVDEGVVHRCTTERAAMR